MIRAEMILQPVYEKILWFSKLLFTLDLDDALLAVEHYFANRSSNFTKKQQIWVQLTTCIHNQASFAFR